MSGAADRPVVPATPIVDLYLRTHDEGFGRKKRLALAREYLANPAALAFTFGESVRLMIGYAPGTGPFYDGNRTAEIGDKVKKTHHFALRLERDQLTDVLPGSLPVPDDLPDGVVDVPAKELSFRYVDRELIGSHVAGGVTQAGAAVRMDLLLATSTDHTAVIAELKTHGDKDPFAALVQVMACAAQLVSEQQYERLRVHARTAPRSETLRKLTDPVFVDLSIFLHEFDEDDSYMGDLLTVTEKLSAKLLAEPDVRRHVRGISCLTTHTVEDRIEATKRFALRGAPHRPVQVGIGLDA